MQLQKSRRPLRSRCNRNQRHQGTFSAPDIGTISPFPEKSAVTTLREKCMIVALEIAILPVSMTSF